jgi:hypothetical protein
MKLIPTALFVVLVGAAALAQAPLRQDGRWEVRMEMSMPGMPMNMPPMTTTQCITAADAKDPQKVMPPRDPKGGENDCAVSDYRTDGNKVTWSMTCQKPQPMTGKGEMIYSGDSYTGTMTMDMNGMTMSMKYTGKRLGDCAG